MTTVLDMKITRIWTAAIARMSFKKPGFMRPL